KNLSSDTVYSAPGSVHEFTHQPIPADLRHRSVNILERLTTGWHRWITGSARQQAAQTRGLVVDPGHTLRVEKQIFQIIAQRLGLDYHKPPFCVWRIICCGRSFQNIMIGCHYLTIHRAQARSFITRTLQHSGWTTLAHGRPETGYLYLVLRSQKPESEIIEAHAHPPAVFDPSPAMAVVIVVISRNVEAGCLFHFRAP